MCQCIERIESATMDRLKEKHPERKLIEEGDSGEIQNQSFMLDGSGTKLYVPLKYRYTFTKKDGSESAERSDTVNILFTFCPFCGTKY